VCEKADLGGKWLARTRMALARAIAKADPPRAVALAKQARDWYATIPTLAHDLAEIDSWLAGR